ncbi:MAG: hypothetical protein ACYDIC_01795 [Desulfobaccales bacterium]
MAPKIRLMVLVALLAVIFSTAAGGLAQTAKPVDSPRDPRDYLLLTVFLKHDQAKTLDEINQDLERSGFWRAFPPMGIEVESWYVMMGLGQVVTLRVPPYRLREVNLAIENTAWKAFRTEIYATYDYKDIAQGLKERATSKGK